MTSYFSSGRARTSTLAMAVAAALLPAGAAEAAPRGSTTIDRPAPATAFWSVETYPGITREQALADNQPAVGGDSPLTPVGLGWEQDARLVGGEASAFDGASSYLSASPTTLDSAGTFSVAAWVRLTDASVSRDFVSKAGSRHATLSVGYDKASNRWQVRMPTKTGKGAKWSVARSTSAPRVGLWTHVAVVHDAAARTLTLWVDGVAEATKFRVTAVNHPAGEFRLGRGDATWWRGNLADVRVYDRTLVAQDFTGWRASDPGSGGFDEPGLLRPVQVGKWNFENAIPCYDESIDDPTLCSAPDSTAFDRQLYLTQGSYVDAGRQGSVLALDGTHWIDDPSDPHYGETTREYARSQANRGEPGNPVWADAPVLRTDQSFTLATWVRLDPSRGAQTVVSQDAAGGHALRLGWEPVDGGRWTLVVPADGAGAPGGAATEATAPAADADLWHHLVVVLDAAHRQVLLHVDGTLVRTVALDAAGQPRQATGSLVVGRVSTAAGPEGWLYGQVDDLGAYQGAMSSADVAALFVAQRV
ncbi:LamG domain-containing protein [Micromonospora sp. WMMC415]|uniref:LamG domain-containing protein n=1 Tax=Micromonospora sp. WMMC415 TaxID=2675222 RepID=UPI0018AFE59C|nr:LamG domain-containing protein [Micromonospora sp. WMMC415]